MKLPGKKVMHYYLMNDIQNIPVCVRRNAYTYTYTGYIANSKSNPLHPINRPKLLLFLENVKKSPCPRPKVAGRAPARPARF